jgi:hypothetical protein
MSYESNSWKQGFMFSQPPKKTTNVLCINLVLLEHLQFHIHQLLGGSLLLTHGEVMVAFQQHWKQKSFITIFHHRITCFQPIKEKTNLRILNLWSNIKNNMI